jgi:hypothetical protein
VAQLLARMSGLETSLATLTQPSRERAAALEKKVEALTTMLKAMKGSAMPGAVLAFFSASRSAPPCSTGSPWRTFTAEPGAALRHCLGPKVRRCRPHACPRSWGRAFCPEPAVVPALCGHDGSRFMPPPAVARQRQREQGRGLLPWPEGLGVFVLVLAARVSPAGCPESWRPGIDVASKHLAC